MQPWQKTLAAMWVAMFFVFMEFQLAIAFFPIFLQKDLGLTFDQAKFWMGFLMAMPALLMCFSQPIAGLIADRIGRKPVVLFSVVATSLLRAMWYFAHSPQQILILGMTAGLLGGGVMASAAIVASAAPRERMGSVLGTLQASFAIGFVVGPLAGAFLSKALGYRGTFLTQAAFAALGAVVILVWVKDDHVPEKRPVGLTFWQAVTRDLRPLTSSRQVLVLWIAMFTMAFGFALIIPLLTLFVQALGIREDAVPVVSGGMMFLVGSVQSVLAPLFGRLGDRVGYKKVMVAGAYGTAVFIAPQTFVTNVWQFLGLRMCSTACGAAMMPTSNALVARLMPASQYGRAYGLLSSSRTLAFALGPLVGGLLAVQYDIRLTFLVCAALSFAGAVWAHYGIEEPPSDEAPGNGEEDGSASDDAR